MAPAPHHDPELVPLTEAEFSAFQKLIYQLAGIHMTETKKALISGRLMKRLRHYRFSTYTDYLDLVKNPDNADEIQIMINLLTTNETYFFREPKHFDWLRKKAALRTSETFRVWSAACSAGQEVYTIAMILAEELGLAGAGTNAEQELRSRPGWEVLGTDISEKTLNQALSATYPIEQASQIPDALLKSYCLKGMRDASGKFCIKPELTAHTRFFRVNLIEALPRNVGQFDVIFLRNVMIYFDRPTRKKVAENLMSFLKPDGNLVVGHAESLHGITDRLKAIQPTIYAATKT